MPIKIPDDLPAREELEREGLVVMRERDATRQDIRPLRIALLNLMPRKEKTETQLARLIGATPLQVELTLLTTGSYQPGNVSRQHMESFYRAWAEVADQKFDGLIITGAPVETLPFEEVKYWQELEQILDWSLTHVHSTLNICWGAQAALYHFYNIPKQQLPEKMFGIFTHRNLHPQSPLLRGFNDRFPVPVSRHTETRADDIAGNQHLQILSDSPESGVCLVQDAQKRHIFMLNHLEYDASSLRDEYFRDVAEGKEIALPKHYFPDNDPNNAPANLWRAHAHLFIANWINETYQTTPFDPAAIGQAPA